MSRMILTDYEISMKTGFILESPLRRLPSYFDPWNKIALSLVQHIENRTLRDEIAKLPVLDVSSLSGGKEIKLAHLQLAIMTTGYLWMDPSDVPKVLPRPLAVPLYAMYEKYDLAPVITYADLFLCNNVLKDPNRPPSVENMEAIIDVPGKSEWNWFFAVGTMVEHEFAAAMQSFQNVLDGIDEGDENKMALSLNQLAESVLNMKATLTRMHEKLSIEGFFLKLSTFFNGYDQDPLPDGLIFEGIKDEPVKMAHANAGQTPIFKSLDALCGIQHQEDRHQYTETVSEYMYPSHRKFIADLRQRPVQLKSVVESSCNTELKASFNNLIQAMVSFRSYHVQMVTKYFILGVKKISPEEQDIMKPVKKFTMNYIKGMRDDCKTAPMSS
ncbi:myoglobin-like [Haliotis asinina]|uniref:myoglobin-like n=1 Tax=Haliotis asinina TaxID=109174 RepID=UPI003532563E